jgi:DNA-binding NarL/FixJ family response regulator
MTVRVMTIDDQPHFRAVAQELVARTPGFELVGEVQDGAAAVGEAARLDPDMVLVDVRMPGMDGIEVADRLRAADGTRVVVLATTLDTHELAGRARAAGAAALVRKQWLTPRLLRGLWIAHRRR